MRGNLLRAKTWISILAFWGLSMFLMAASFNEDKISKEDADQVSAQISFLIDPSSELNFTQVMQAKDFKPLTSDKHDFGMTESTVWLKLETTASADVTRFLTFFSATLSSVEFFWADEKGEKSLQSGISLPPEKRHNQRRLPMFQLKIPQGKSTSFIRIQSKYYLDTKFALLRPSELDTLTNNNLFNGFIYGMLFALVLYHLLIWIMNPIALYSEYVFYAIAVFLSILISHGNMDLWFWTPLVGGWGNYTNIFTGTTVLLFLNFARRFLRFRELYPIVNRILMVMMGMIFVGIFSFLPGLAMLGPLGDVTYISAVLLIFTLGVRGAIQNQPGARYFIAGYILLGAALIFQLLSIYNVIPLSTLYVPVMEIGVILQMILMSLGIGALMRGLREENEIFSRKVDSAKTMLQILSHDLANPLTVIYGFATLRLNDYPKDSKEFRSWDSILRATRQELHILNSVRDFLKLDMNDFIVQNVDTTPQIVEERLRFLFEERMKPKNIQFMSNVSTCQFNFLSDEHVLVNHVLSNLISNAIKFTPDGGVVGLDFHEDEHEVRIVVKDSGQGMSEEDFAIFQQKIHKSEMQSGTGTGGEVGTGFGLLIVKKCVAALGGRLRVENIKSNVENWSASGLCFTITIPKIGVLKHKIA